MQMRDSLSPSEVNSKDFPITPTTRRGSPGSGAGDVKAAILTRRGPHREANLGGLPSREVQELFVGLRFCF